MSSIFRSICIAVLAPFVCESSAFADIMGFDDLSAFTINAGDELPAPTPLPGGIRLTDGLGNESRSIFYNVPQDIRAFEAAFTYRSAGSFAPGTTQGATFVLQNSSMGLNTVAIADFLGVYTKFGYSDWFNRFQDSVALSLEHGSLSGGSSSTDLYLDGIVESGSNASAPVDLFSGNPIRVELDYDGAVLHERLTDTLTLASFETSYPVDIASIVGDSTAYVGLTAASGCCNPAFEQYFSDFQFVSTVPEPSSLCMAAFGLAAMAAACRLRPR